MTQVAPLVHALRFAREFSLQLLQDLQTDEQWLARPHDRANHALWFAGHMGNADNFALGLIAPSQVMERDDMQKLFGMGSAPTSDPDMYPSVSEVREWMDGRRAALLEAAEKLTDEDLERPTSESAPPFIPTVRSALQFLAWHEGLHAGQITVVHRELGNAPIAGRPQEEPANA